MDASASHSPELALVDGLAPPSPRLLIRSLTALRRPPRTSRCGGRRQTYHSVRRKKNTGIDVPHRRLLLVLVDDDLPATCSSAASLRLRRPPPPLTRRRRSPHAHARNSRKRLGGAFPMLQMDASASRSSEARWRSHPCFTLVDGLGAPSPRACSSRSLTAWRRPPRASRCACSAAASSSRLLRRGAP